MNTQPKVMFMDIETSPCLGWFWRTGKQVVSSDQVLDHTKIICICYMWEGEDKVHTLTWDRKQDDKKMLEKFSKETAKADCVIGHNGDNFDIKHVQARLAFHRLPPIDIVLTDDTLKMVRNKFNLASYKLGYLGEYFGVGRKLETGGGIKLWLHVWLENNRRKLEEMCKYCRKDVKLLADVYECIKPYVKHKLNRAMFSEERVCPKCGSGKLIKHGTRRVVSNLQLKQRWLCQDCGATSTTGVNKQPAAKHKMRST